MEIMQYIRLFRKWWWLIILAAVIGGSIAYFTTQGQNVTYRAQTTISIGRFIDNPNPEAGQFRLGSDLAGTYARYVKSNILLERTIDSLGLDYDVNDLSDMVEAEAIVGAPLLEITVVSSESREEAVQIVEGITNELFLVSPTNLSRDEIDDIEFLEEQIDNLSEQIAFTREEVNEINATLDDPNIGGEQESALRERRTVLLDSINQASSVIAQYTNTVVGIRNRSNQLEVFDRAQTSRRVQGISRMNSATLGAVVGAILAAGAVLLLEYFNVNLRTSLEASNVLSLPVMGSITRFSRRRASPQEQLIMRSPTRAPAVEGFRTLRTNVLLSGNHDRQGTYLITSAREGEGKSVTAANLATSMAFDELRVLLIDANMLDPTIHTFFGLQNNVGLSQLLQHSPVKPSEEALKCFEQNNDKSQLPEPVLTNIQDTDISGLWVMTSGPVMRNATEMLSSTRMRAWIDTLRHDYGFDLLVIDTSAVLLVADSSALASSIDTEVLLVVDCRKTTRESALQAKEVLLQLGAKVKGIVANRVNPSDESYVFSRMPQEENGKL